MSSDCFEGLIRILSYIIHLHCYSISNNLFRNTNAISTIMVTSFFFFMEKSSFTDIHKLLIQNLENPATKLLPLHWWRANQVGSLCMMIRCPGAINSLSLYSPDRNPSSVQKPCTADALKNDSRFELQSLPSVHSASLCTVSLYQEESCAQLCSLAKEVNNWTLWAALLFLCLFFPWEFTGYAVIYLYFCSGN